MSDGGISELGIQKRDCEESFFKWVGLTQVVVVKKREIGGFPLNYAQFPVGACQDTADALLIPTQ